MRPPILVEVERGGAVESRHRGIVAIADAQGNDSHAIGDPDHEVYIRSALKPFAAALVVASGAADACHLTSEELALVAGSHAGTDEDLRVVRSLLARGGIPEEALRNGIKESPGDEPTKIRLAAAGEEPGQLRQMCSGEHSGLLLLATHRGWPLEGYWEPDHPVQQALMELVARLFTDGVPPRTATDDCALPTPAIPLGSIARGYAWLARPDRLPRELADLAEPLTRVRDAMLEHPDRVGGAGVFDTDLMAQSDGAFVAKEGAEGILGVGSVGCGLGVAFEVDDGDKTRRATPVVAIAALQQLEMLGDDVAGRLREEHWPRQEDSLGRPTGSVRAVFDLETRA